MYSQLYVLAHSAVAVILPGLSNEVCFLLCSAPSAGDSGASCTVPLIASAALDHYNLVVHEPWRGVPAECGGTSSDKWDYITLQFDGQVAGVQFDRFGGLWFAGVELLRTTTPEPATGVSHGGTSWSIRKDITDYASLFALAANSVNTSLSVPNVVTDVYTGTEYIRVTATFHLRTRGEVKQPMQVVPLLDPSSSPWSITGLTNTSQPLLRPIALTPSHAGRVKRMYLDVYASNHGGSEEFWYTTESAYREIDVYVDGCLAAAFYPALVVYTGGICPLLWRPLVSLVALDIPAYRLDITAFAGLLNDGAAHEFSFNVVNGDPAKSSGVWYIDPVLVYELDTVNPLATYSGALTSDSCLDPAAARKVRDIKVDKAGGTTGSMVFTVTGTNTKSGDQSKMVSHEYKLSAENQQPRHGPTTGTMSTEVITTLGRSYNVSDRQVWAYRVDDDSSDDRLSKTFLLKAKIALKKQRSKKWNSDSMRPLLLALELSQDNSGLYNRSEANHTLIYAEDNNSTEVFTFGVGGETPCYSRNISAAKGHVTTDIINAGQPDTRFPCYAFLSQLPGVGGLRLCGSEFCGFLPYK
jgi:hypothetical protein